MKNLATAKIVSLSLWPRAGFRIARVHSLQLHQPTGSRSTFWYWRGLIEVTTLNRWCRRVGYLSPSQFSREYARFFGSAPTKDIARLRAEGFASADGER